MNALKEKNMMKAYDGFKGYQTVQSIKAQISEELFERLTGRELGLVMSAVNKAYHNGRATLGGIDICDDAVWLPWGGGKYDPAEALPGSVIPKTGENGQLIPIAALRKIKINDTGKTCKYTLDFTEEF